ncbi:alpha/beta-hydrolase [Aulographum hederae CBS 113979]|uniref:Alpha/beta-hydrolase n=1 Tax=Aulographum hederae CBS 113979 TaxID=1176131 RepID=A0A6G1HFQ4_9PEZI|nr:alpha/beta-hydrolase [Aulographum hederae CBS 113979]
MVAVTSVEGWHTVEDETQLYTKTWNPAGEIKARVVFIHGFSDHCNTYGNFFPYLASRNIQVLTLDQRGWGRSAQTPSHRGLTGPTSLVLSDISSFLTSLLSSTTTPLFLMGHSMGGAEILTYAAEGPASIRAHIRGYLAESPFIAFAPAMKPSPVLVFLGRLAGKVLPRRQMKNPIKPELVSRDEAVCQAYREDELCHDTGTLEGLAGMIARARGLEGGEILVGDKAGEGERTRLWVGHGTGDLICDYEGTKRWFDKLGEGIEDKEFKSYEGWYHKLHAEPGEMKEIYANDVADWILKRSEEPVSVPVPTTDLEPKAKL